MMSPEQFTRTLTAAQLLQSLALEGGRYSSFDQGRVAPPGMLDHKATARVAPNPRQIQAK
jgi:hypothetical protein